MDILITLITNFIDMFVEMSFYMMLGLLFVGILNTYIKKEDILKHLGKDNFACVVKSALVGVPLPLCSCGVVPTAVELKKDGASNGAVVSFLVSTPQTGVDSIFATYSLMGLVMAIYRPVAAFLSGIISGLFVDVFAKNEVINTQTHSSCCCCHEEHHHEASSCCGHNEPISTGNLSKIKRVFTYAFGSFLDEIAGHFMIGVLLASLITTFIPADFFVKLGLDNGILAMIAMILIGIPMYICSTSSIPIAISLVGKGLSMGSAFVFLFTGPVTNIASILVLSKALGKKITTIYILCVSACSIAFGILLDFLIENFDLVINTSSVHAHHGVISVLNYAIAIVFFGLIIKSFLKIKK